MDSTLKSYYYCPKGKERTADNKLSGWKIALIVVFAVLFVVGSAILSVFTAYRRIGREGTRKTARHKKSGSKISKIIL